MKTNKYLIALFVTGLLFSSLTINAQTAYKVISNMAGLIEKGDFERKSGSTIESFAKNEKQQLFTPTTYTEATFQVARGSIFEIVNDTPVSSGQATDPDTFILVSFTTVTEGSTVTANTAYLMPQSKFKDSGYVIFFHGVDYGVLSLPVKIRWNPNVFTPGGTIGGYGGYKHAAGNNWTYTGIVSIGLSVIATQDINSKDVQNLGGVTWGVGIIFSNQGKFQMGLVGGADALGGTNGKNWQYENKLWGAVSIGFNFVKSN